MPNSIFNVLYIDYIKPMRTLWMVIFVTIIFVTAAFFAYKWYIKSTIENLGTSDVANNNRRVSEAELLFFSADWCPHCKNAKPEWDSFKKEYDGKEMGFYKINCQSVDCTDGENELIQKYSIDGYPTVIMIKDNERVNFDAGITESSLKSFIESSLN
tara:strand:+ start:1927 stop:2397 length:471 start_codon:yes stop_codon:yes gene_type:complete